MPSTTAIPTGRPSFLDAPRCADLERLRADVTVIGIPYTTPHDLASSRGPSSPAPGTVREQSLRYAGRTGHYDFDLGGDLFAGRAVRLVDAGDARAVPGRYEDNARDAAAAIGAILDRGGLPVVLGGDHAATLPVARALAGRGPLGVVHLGASLDWRDEVDGVREAAPSVMRRVAELPRVTALMQVGLRGVGAAARADVAAARAAGSVLVRAEDVHETGVPAILRSLPPAPRYLLSLDLSGLDPAVAPGVEVPAFGGLSYFEVTNVLKGLAARGPVAGLALVGIVPSRDHHDVTSLLGARLALNLLGALAHAGRLGTAAGEGAAPETAADRPAGAVLAATGGRR
jgi:agmatinase